jgi:hypothetical protein
MLTPKEMMRMWDTGCCANLDVALDRHDNPNHRRGYEGPALPENYVPKPGEKVIRVRLDYDEHGNIVQV